MTLTTFIDLSVHIENNEYTDHPGGSPEVRPCRQPESPHAEAEVPLQLEDLGAGQGEGEKAHPGVDDRGDEGSLGQGEAQWVRHGQELAAGWSRAWRGTSAGRCVAIWRRPFRSTCI